MSVRISVIIPCYNADKYLKDCICSLQAQTFRDFEAIFIDDGSTDRTADILKKSCSEDTRFRIVTQMNGGVSVARNTGLKCAKGDWVFFLDADDELSEDCLEKLFSSASEDSDLVIGMHAVFGDRNKEIIYPEGFWWKMKGKKRRDHAARRLIEGDSVLNIMCNKLHRRSFLIREGIRLEEELKVAEDALFNLQVVLTARAFAFLPTVTYYYRSHPTSATHTVTMTNYEIHRPWLLAMGKWLAEKGLIQNYYRFYTDSVILRFYKDGGIINVLQNWENEIRPVLLQLAFSPSDLKGTNKIVFFLVRTGYYPYLYPLFVPFQILGRKTKSFAEWLDRCITGRGVGAV